MALNNNPTLEEINNELDRLNKLIIDRGGSRTVTPSTSNQILSKGNYKGDITILGDSDLIPGNILKGKNVFNVNGTANYVKSITSGDNYNIFNSNTIYVSQHSDKVYYEKYVHTNSFLDGNYRLSFKLRSRMSKRNITCKVEHMRGSTIIKTIEQYHESPLYDEVITKYTHDFNGVKAGDRFRFSIKSMTTTDTDLRDINFRCNIAFG